MRLATALLLTCALFGGAPATAQAAASASGSVSYAAQPSHRTGISTGIAKSTGGSSGSSSRRTSRGGGFSSRYGQKDSSTGRSGKMPLWQAILVLLGFGGAVVWGLVLLVRKIRRAVTG